MNEEKNIRPKKSLGQHFLRDVRILKRIVEVARIGPDDQVLEIGPGPGYLTRELAFRAKRLLALELDERFVAHLGTQFAEAGNVDIVHTDALSYGYGTLPGTWKIVANLPYYISTPIIQRLLSYREKFSTMTLMLQKEVAERISSPPGVKEYGYLTVLVGLYAEPKIEFTVPAEAFTPAPDVDSAVITLAVRNQPAVTMSDESTFIRTVKAAFSQRRKTLRNSLKQLNIPKERMDSVMNKTGIDLGRRAETLSIAEFGILSDFLHF